jgi:hypothetical protein
MLKLFGQGMNRIRIGALGCLLLGGVAWGQTVAPLHPPLSSQDETTQAKMAAFRQQRQVLFAERQALVAQGATPQQVQAWRLRNATRFVALEQQAKDLAASQPQLSLSVNQKASIPANGSPQTKEFLQNQAALVQNFAQLHNQVQAATSPATKRAALTLGLQQNQALWQRQAQLTQVLTQQGQMAPASVSAPLPIPPNATPQMKVFLTANAQLVREQIQLRSQYATADSQVRETAMKQWRQQNAARLAQVDQLAQTLSTTTGN